MKKGKTRWIALLLALLLTLGMSALAAETVSDGFRVDGAQARPEEPEGGETEGEPEIGNEMPATPAAAKKPVEIPAAPVGQKQVCLNSDSDSVKIFESADSTSLVVGNAFHGDVVDVFVSADGWSFIRMGGTKGWIASGHLKEVGAAEPKQPGETRAPEPNEPEAAAPEATEKPEATVEPEASEEPEVPAFEYERDEEGELLLDENGNPIPVLPEGATEKPVVFQRDEEGELLLDENGNPIPVQFVPVEAEKIDGEPDAENPNRHVDIYADFGGDMLTMGQQLNLIAALDGYDGLEYAIQWQTSMDDATWTDVGGATSAVLPVVVTEETYVSYWRVEVTITGVIGAEATAPAEAEAAPAAEADARRADQSGSSVQ